MNINTIYICCVQTLNCSLDFFITMIFLYQFRVQSLKKSKVNILSVIRVKCDNNEIKHNLLSVSTKYSNRIPAITARYCRLKIIPREQQ